MGIWISPPTSRSTVFGLEPVRIGLRSIGSGTGSLSDLLESGGSLRGGAVYVQDADGVTAQAIVDIADDRINPGGVNIDATLNQAFFDRVDGLAANDLFIVAFTEQEPAEELSVSAEAGDPTAAFNLQVVAPSAAVQLSVARKRAIRLPRSTSRPLLPRRHWRLRCRRRLAIRPRHSTSRRSRHRLLRLFSVSAEAGDPTATFALRAVAPSAALQLSVGRGGQSHRIVCADGGSAIERRGAVLRRRRGRSDRRIQPPHGGASGNAQALGIGGGGRPNGAVQSERHCPGSCPRQADDVCSIRSRPRFRVAAMDGARGHEPVHYALRGADRVRRLDVNRLGRHHPPAHRACRRHRVLGHRSGGQLRWQWRRIGCGQLPDSGHPRAVAAAVPALGGWGRHVPRPPVGAAGRRRRGRNHGIRGILL